MSTDADRPQGAPTPGPWYEMPVRFFARCGPGSVSNSTDPDHGGIFQSFARKPPVCLSPFCIVRVRRHPVSPVPLYDAVLIDPRTGERIEVTRADAGGIAQAINTRCGYPRAALKAAVYDLLADYFRRFVDERRGQ